MKRDPTGFLRQEYESLVAQSLDWKIRTLKGPSAPHSNVGGKDVIMLCSNNYLSLSNHPKLKRAAIQATREYGAGSGSVRPIAGTMDLHEELERRIARFKNREAALFYMSGFATNAGLIPQLVGEGDTIITDELNHGSIIDGCRLTKAQRLIYKHRDMGELENCLREADKASRRILVISDGVFSMDGDIAPVDRIARAAEPYGAMVYIDDSHGEGVLGEGGRGAANHFHVEDKVHVEMGTFSKALGVVGGYAAGSNDLRLFALNKSRTWLLSASHPPATIASCIAAIDVLERSRSGSSASGRTRATSRSISSPLGSTSATARRPSRRSCSGNPPWPSASRTACTRRVSSLCRSSSRWSGRTRHASGTS